MKDKNLSYKRMLIWSQRDISYALEMSLKKSLFHIYEVTVHTMPPPKRNPVHSIALYWPDFKRLNSHWKLKFLRFFFQNYLVHETTFLLTPFKSKLTVSVMSSDRLNVRLNHHFNHFLSKRTYFLFCKAYYENDKIWVRIKALKIQPAQYALIVFSDILLNRIKWTV